MLPLNVPAFLGLNTQNESGLLGPEWATKLQNAVLDSSGRVAVRKGWNSLTTTPLAADIVQLVEYHTHAGARQLIASTATTFHLSTDGGASFSNITGAITFTNGNWQFMNFVDDMYAIQAGKAPCRYDPGLGVFTAIADVNAPQGGVGVAAFGRLWIVGSDGYTIRFCALLDGTDWTSADSGSISVRNLWPATDTVQALAAFNNKLLIFGRNNILVVEDGTGDVRGLDPFTAFVTETISGVGCIARDSVQQVEGDVWFLSASGLQSLGRLIQEKNNPLENLSRNVQDYLMSQYDLANDVRSVYSPENRFYLLSLPTANGGTAFVFDTRGRLPDGSARCMGTWVGLVPNAVIRDLDGDVIIALNNITGELGTYSSYLDDASTYLFDYESAWMDINKEGYLLIPKRISGVFFLDSTAQIEFKWAYDFSTEFNRTTRSFGVAGTFSEFGIAEYGIAEFGGGVNLRSRKIPTSGTGRYIKLGLSASINNTSIAVQSLDLYAKIGRLA